MELMKGIFNLFSQGLPSQHQIFALIRQIVRAWTPLQTLNLYLNQLSSLPPEVSAWTSLQTLNLYLNQLSSLPPEVSAWTSLQTLNLYLNQLSSLPPEVSAWTSLQTLDLGYNQLSSLPSEVSAWTSLQTLNLYHNQLSSLPPEVSAWTSLQTLNLYHNQLSSLPSEVSAWTSLLNLELFGNSELHSEVARMSVGDILAFYAAFDTSARLFHQRIMVLGHSGKGKTSLIKRLMTKERTPKQEPGREESTFAIDIRLWQDQSVSIERDGHVHPVDIEFWDFAGQNDFYPTHRLFLEARALYWIVFSWEDAMERADDIIRSIRDVFLMVSSLMKRDVVALSQQSTETALPSQQNSSGCPVSVTVAITVSDMMGFCDSLSMARHDFYTYSMYE